MLHCSIFIHVYNKFDHINSLLSPPTLADPLPLSKQASFCFHVILKKSFCFTDLMSLIRITYSNMGEGFFTGSWDQWVHH